MTAPLTPGSSLNAARRRRELGTLGEETVDLLVIGGGVTGAGVALDAASRGLSVVLAEKHDLAFGTSRWSSKLVHGGLRYLATGQVGIAHESAVERDVLMRSTAPHLVRPLRQVYPIYHPGPGARAHIAARLERATVHAGLRGGDLLRLAARTPGDLLPRSRRIGAADVRTLVPGVRTDGLRGGILGWDGQLYDDARLVVGLARTAAAHGARVLTRCEVSHATGTGAVLTDTLTGQSTQLRARMVISAAGVWAGELAPGIAVRPSRGTHLVLPKEAVRGLRAGLLVGVPDHYGRMVFALPAPDGRVYAGLTDEDSPGPVPDVPTATEDEVDFLLNTLSPALATPLTRGDLLGTFSGLRPLLQADGESADLSRRHAVITAPDGLVTVTGGKLTTYRRMAEDAVDAALASARMTAGRCRTRRLPLVGAAPRDELARLRGVPGRLVAKYGTEAGVVAEHGPLDPVAEGTSVTEAELRFACRHEGALDADDVLDRRTRIGLDPALRAACADAAAAALADA